MSNAYTMSPHPSLRAGLAALLVFCFCSAPTRAADQITEGADYLSVLGGYVWPARSLGTTGSGAGFAGIFGRQFSDHASAEGAVQAAVFETGVDAGTDYYQYGATVDLAYTLFDRHAEALITPFVLIGVGAVEDDFHPDDRGITLLTEAGVGAVTRPLFEGVRLRLDARYVRDSKDGGHAEPRVLAGIEIPLGRVRTVTR